MKKRINLAAIEPEAIKTIAGISKYVENSRISKLHQEMIKIRTSQLNGCAYCIDKHARDARNLGETEQRLYLLSAWKETDFFSEEERCILAMTEEITLISKQGLTDETYEQATRLFDDQYIAQVIMAIINMNAWNRIGVSTRMKPVREK